MSSPPNSLTKAAEASNLPRQARARVGQTHDPIPEGKHEASEPHHHFPVVPAGHDVERTNPKTAEELGVAPQELEKMHKQSREHVSKMSSLQRGMDFHGASTSSNKQMPSTHRKAETFGKLSKTGN